MNKKQVEIKLAELREEYKNAPPEKKLSIQFKARPYQTMLKMLELGKTIKSI